MNNWKRILNECANGDNIIECTLTEEELLEDFDDGYGGIESKEFTAWSERWVYFPICYDGAVWAGRAPRNPCDYKCPHMGGG